MPTETALTFFVAVHNAEPVSEEVASGLNYARASDTGWDANGAPIVMMDTAPKPLPAPKERKTIWQHLREAD